MNYRKVNNLIGWITGLIAYIVYIKTMEPTASYWDCGEFLACAYKLEVGHSPGAPFFMLVQRLFGIFSPSAGTAAMFINSLSVLTSALTILFLFWTITHFAKKLLAPGVDNPDNRLTTLIMGAGLIGALAYTFSDTFWFSAVEAEVYGTSSFFTAITFWAILKWENVADQKHADRWIVLIAYLIGISVGVHLLNLLTIPALAMVYYYKRYEASLRGGVIAFIVGCVVLAFVQFGVIQYIPIFASQFDIFFTNSFGLPFDIGSVTFLILFIGFLIWFLLFAKRKNWYAVHTAVLCVLFILIGYSSYIVPIIRSRADVPIDMTNPDNALSLESYVSRDQFGQQPLLYGQDFNSPVVNYKFDHYIYDQNKVNGKDHYDIVGKKMEPEFDPATLRFFPRIYDTYEPAHAKFYMTYLGLSQGETATSGDNLKYFFGYQMNWMWWRYFMWNYAGRQNDMEGQGEPKDGNWISGIKFIDQMRVGDMGKMGYGYRNNEARNQLYFLPLILGLLGIVYQFKRNKKDGIITLTLFFFTGAAIGIYLNMPPQQPRERDYAFAGCTYAFAIWIGLGILLVNDWIKKAIKGKAAAYITIILCLILVPALMAKEEWGDHDRSKKTLARATAYNTLQSCAQNAILFTYGDNDTYPLWYLQEVEGIRKDVRIINTSLLGIDWYIDQLNYRINDADAVPMVWKKEDYIGDRHNYVRYYNNPQIPKDKYFNLTEICNFIVSKDPNNKLQSGNSEEAENYFPSKNFYAPGISKADLVKRGLVKPQDTSSISTDLKFTYPKDVALKNDLTVLNIVAAVAAKGWNRPLYFDAGLPTGNYAGMSNFMKLEGTVFHLVPYRSTDSSKLQIAEQGTVDIDKSYNLFMNTYIWGGADRNDVYFDEKNRIMLTAYRVDAAQLANGLAIVGRNADAVKVLDKVMAGITEHSYFYDLTAYYMINAYYQAGAIDKAKKLSAKVVKNYEDNLNWIDGLNDDGKQMNPTQDDIRQSLSIINSIASIAQHAGDSATNKNLTAKVEYLYKRAKPYINQ